MKNLLKINLITIFVLALSACQTPFFNKTPAPEPKQMVSNTLGDEMILTVTGARMPCQFAKPMQCLVVTDATGKHFGIAYDSIDNFRAEINRQYTLKVRPKLNSYVLDDQQNTLVGYQLVEILNQK